MRKRQCCRIALFCLALVPVFAQQNGPAGLSERPSSTPLAGANRSIALDVVVTDKSGKPVSGLAQQDFTIIDNKQPRKIASFHAVNGATAAAEGPVEVIVFIDGVNTAAAGAAIELQEIQAFLKNRAAEFPGPTSIVMMGDMGVVLGAASSRDANALIAALNQGRSGELVTGKQLGVYGTDGWQQLSLYTLDQLAGYEMARPGRKLLIWISPGWPLVLGDDPSEGLSTKEQKQMFGAIVAFSDKLRQARVTLYQIDPSGLADANQLGTSNYKQFERGVKAASGVLVGSLGLQILADQTGGRVLNSSNDISGEISKCLADASGYYVLSFDAPRGDGPNEYHALDIKIDKPGLTARTRTGYYAQP
jgi:VWFA-related protein